MCISLSKPSVNRFEYNLSNGWAIKLKSLINDFVMIDLMVVKHLWFKWSGSLGRSFFYKQNELSETSQHEHGHEYSSAGKYLKKLTYKYNNNTF